MQPKAVSVPEAGRLLGIGRTLTYELIATGELPTLKIGSRTLVPVEHLSNYVERNTLRSQSAEVSASP